MQVSVWGSSEFQKTRDVKDPILNSIKFNSIIQHEFQILVQDIGRSQRVDYFKCVKLQLTFREGAYFVRMVQSIRRKVEQGRGKSRLRADQDRNEEEGGANCIRPENVEKVT